MSLWVLLLLSPLAEEAVFRGGLQEYLLERWPSPAAVNAAVATVFALAHVAARADWTAFAVVGPAWLLGAVYQRCRRLRVCVLLHAGMNAAWWGRGLL